MRHAAFAALLVTLAACSAAPVGPHGDSGTGADGGGDAAADMPASATDGGPDAGTDADTGGDAADDGGADAAVGCDGTMVALPYPSETAGTDRTEPPSCASCPTFETVSVTPVATTVDVMGNATMIPTDCHWYLESATCGGASGAFLPNEFGVFSLHLPLFCGTNRLQLVCTSAAGTAVSTRDLTGPACVSRDVQVTLSWGATANDMELHLVRAGAHINDAVGDCTWFTCMSASPDWGAIGDPTDDPHKDVDNTGHYGPENVFLTRAADGSYEVMVEYWGSGTPDTSEIAITLGGATVWRGSKPMSLYDVWDVGTLRFPASTFTPVDTLTSCTAAWRTGGSFGCNLPIP